MDLAQNPLNPRTNGWVPYGGGTFVLLFDPIIFGSPTGGKEIDVVVNH